MPVLACAAMQKQYKTIDGYFSQGLGLDTATIDKLRDNFNDRG